MFINRYYLRLFVILYFFSNYKYFCCNCCKKCYKCKNNSNENINIDVNNYKKNNNDDNEKNKDKENNIVKDDNGNEINLKDYICIHDMKNEKYTPEYIIDFNNFKEEDKKIKFIFLTKTIEWANWWCWMISEIQSLFNIPLFFEYIANGNFNDHKYRKLKKLQELLLEMIKNQNDPKTKTFSKNKFEPYYKYFIDDKIIHTGQICKYVNKKEYCNLIKYGKGGGLYSFSNYLNILKCFYFQNIYNYENSNIIYQYKTKNLPPKSFGKDYWKCNNIDEFKNKIEDYYKNKNLICKIIFKFLGDDYFKKILKEIDINDCTNYMDLDNHLDFMFILNENIKNEFKDIVKELDKNKTNLTEYCNIIDNIFKKFDFELNSIIVHPADNHMFNINYNNNDKCFYSYDSLGGNDFKKLSNDEVINLIEKNPLKYNKSAHSVFFISVHNLLLK